VLDAELLDFVTRPIIPHTDHCGVISIAVITHVSARWMRMVLGPFPELYDFYDSHSIQSNGAIRVVGKLKLGGCSRRKANLTVEREPHIS